MLDRTVDDEKRKAARRKASARWRQRHPEQDTAAQRRYREANREMARASKSAYTAKNTAKNRAIINAAKDVPCADCGNRYPAVAMDLHHKDPSTKEFVISQSTQYPPRRVLAEIAKCEALCANCHRIRHGLHHPLADEWPATIIGPGLAGDGHGFPGHRGQP